MKYMFFVIFTLSPAFASDAELVLQREIPLQRMPICKAWIPEGRVWGCTHFERRDMADRATIEALLQEIVELKERIKVLESAL